LHSDPGMSARNHPIDAQASGDATTHAILVHGAWQGAWIWEAFAPLLYAWGLSVEAIDLPGSRGELQDAGFEQQVAALLVRIDAARAPVVLVAHGGGAVVAAQAADRRPQRVAVLVMIAGIMLPSGRSLGDVIASMVAEGHDPSLLAGIRPHLQWSADGRVSTVPPQAAIDLFMHDCDPEVARAAAARMVPQSQASRAGVPRLDPARYGTVPRIYVEALRDRSIVIALQRRLQRLSPGASVLSIDTGHAPQVSQPRVLSAMLVPALARLLAKRAAPGAPAGRAPG